MHAPHSVQAVSSWRPRRVALAGASSLRGRELKELLSERSFPAEEIILLDDEAAAGTLTEAGGEAAVIQALDPEGISAQDLVFFAGVREFTARFWKPVAAAGAALIDLSGALGAEPEARPWIPALDKILPPPEPPEGRIFYSPGAAAIVATTLAGALRALAAQAMACVFLQPVSESGQEGIAELEGQTAKLLSLQPISTEFYDAQVAFNLLRDFGAGSGQHLNEVRSRIGADVARYLGGRAEPPAVQLLHAPVFYSHAFTASVRFDAERTPEEIEQALTAAGIEVAREPAGPSNISVGGSERIVAAGVERDAAAPRFWWIWGAADNIRLASFNALAIAEKFDAH